MNNMFLSLTDIEGETLDEDRKKEIEIRDWGWGITNGASFAMSKTGAANSVLVDNITIYKVFDKSSIALAQFCTSGEHIAEGTITCYKTDGEGADAPVDAYRLKYLEVKLTDIMVKEVSWPEKGDHGGLNEKLILTFSTFHIIYQPQKNDGIAQGYAEHHYDIPNHRGSGSS
jgi:type VI secretion system secreted protein Hcp